jgi:hypothetical protein
MVLLAHIGSFTLVGLVLGFILIIDELLSNILGEACQVDHFLLVDELDWLYIHVFSILTYKCLFGNRGASICHERLLSFSFSALSKALCSATMIWDIIALNDLDF